jgi:hypothetical protein
MTYQTKSQKTFYKTKCEVSIESMGRKGKTSSEQFHALVHQVGGQVIFSDVLLDA